MRKLPPVVLLLVGGPLLAQAEDLAFTNPAITTPTSIPRQTSSGVVPAPEAASASGDDSDQAEDNPISDTALTALIGMDRDAFVRLHPGGTCVRQGSDAETCIYRAGTSSAGTQSDCPLVFACTDAMYQFRDGRLTGFQSGLQFEYEWKKAFTLARKQYGVPVVQSTRAGESAFFRTGKGVLGLGRSFAAPGRPPAWAIRYDLSGATPDPADLSR
jgi:hypothetical protein